MFSHVWPLLYSSFPLQSLAHLSHSNLPWSITATHTLSVDELWGFDVFGFVESQGASSILETVILRLILLFDGITFASMIVETHSCRALVRAHFMHPHNVPCQLLPGSSNRSASHHCETAVHRLSTLVCCCHRWCTFAPAVILDRVGMLRWFLF